MLQDMKDRDHIVRVVRKGHHCLRCYDIDLIGRLSVCCGFLVELNAGHAPPVLFHDIEKEPPAATDIEQITPAIMEFSDLPGLAGSEVADQGFQNNVESGAVSRTVA